MARVQNTLIGRASGSVGQVVFLTWKLINVTRAKPVSVANPDTIPQQTQRNRFAQTVGLYSFLKTILEIGIGKRNRKMTLFNYFQKLNVANAFFANGDGTVSIIPDHLLISKGLLTKTPLNSVIAQNGFTGISIDWLQRNDNLMQSDDDELYLAVHNVRNNDWVYLYGERVRFWGFVTLNGFMPLQTGDTLLIWSFFKSAKNGEVSDTEFIQKEVTL